MPVSKHPSVGQRVQVYNPRPLCAGVVVGPPEYQNQHEVVRVQWDDGSSTWARVDLLRVLDAR